MRKASIILSFLFCSFLPLTVSAQDYVVMTADKIDGWEAVGRVTRRLTGARETCTGTLVRPDLVLTAAHCVSRQFGKAAADSPNLIFQAGKSGLYVVEVAAVSRIIYHPDYEPGSGLQNVIPQDLAILQLDQPMEVVAPFQVAPLPDQNQSLAFLGHRADGRNPPRLKDDCPWQQVHPRVIEVDCVAISGNSGAGIVSEVDGKRFVVAVMSASGSGKSFATLPDTWLMEQIYSDDITN